MTDFVAGVQYLNRVQEFGFAVNPPSVRGGHEEKEKCELCGAGVGSLPVAPVQSEVIDQ
jgi:hypothetical protein